MVNGVGMHTRPGQGSLATKVVTVLHARMPNCLVLAVATQYTVRLDVAAVERYLFMHKVWNIAVYYSPYNHQFRPVLTVQFCCN